MDEGDLKEEKEGLQHKWCSVMDRLGPWKSHTWLAALLMYSGAMRFKHLASSYYLKALHTASAVRMCASKGKKDTLLLCVCDLVAMCVAWVLCVWTCFAKLSRTLGCIYTCTIYVWVTFLLLFVRFAWRFLLQLMSLGLRLLKLLIHTPSERCIPNIWFRPWKHYLVRHIFSFLSVLSSCFVLYHIKCWLMRLGAKNKYFSKCKDNKQLDTQQ